MKIIKLTKTMYSDMKTLLTKAGAVNLEEKMAYPSHVYVSPKDYKEIKKQLTILFKKQHKGLHKNRILFAVHCELLNLGPVVLNGLTPGIMLVDNRAIQKELESE